MADLPRTPRKIPAAIRREVRQRCGFGCVLCGIPLYHYDHIYGFDDSNPHVASEITLLCALHHDEKTRGFLPVDQVVSANLAPRNVSERVTAPFGLHFQGASVTVTMGGNEFTVSDDGNGAVLFPLVIDDQPIVSFVIREGLLFLNAVFFDEANNPVLVIEQNEIRFSTGLVDVEFTGMKANGGRLIVRSGSGVFIHLAFQLPDRIDIPAGIILCNGVRIDLQPTGLQINQKTGPMTMTDSLFQGSSGIVIGTRWPHGAAINLQNVSRYALTGAVAEHEEAVDES